MTLRTLKTSSSTLKDRLLSRYRVLNKDTEEVIEDITWEYVVDRKPIKIKELTEIIESKTGEEVNDCLVNFLVNSMYKDGLLFGYGKENNDFLPKTAFKSKIYKKFDGMIKVPNTRLMLIGLKLHGRCTVIQEEPKIFRLKKSTTVSSWALNFYQSIECNIPKGGVSFYPDSLPFYNTNLSDITKYSISLEKNKTLLITMEN